MSPLQVLIGVISLFSLAVADPKPDPQLGGLLGGLTGIL